MRSFLIPHGAEHQGATSSMIVMKFGGTSVEDAKAIDRVAKIVRARLADKPVVVVSAMAKVTDGLINMGKAASTGDLAKSLEISSGLRERHLQVASELANGSLTKPLLAEISSGFDRIDELLK